jgi:hypothetical protein
VLLCWKRKLMNRLLATGFTGSVFLLAGVGVQLERSTVWRRVSRSPSRGTTSGGVDGIPARITFDSVRL